MTRIALMGPMPPPVGGATVLFAQLVECLRDSNELQFEVINTAGRNESVFQRLQRGIVCALRIFASVRRVRVLSLHASLRGIIVFGPFLRVISLLSGRPLVLRVFGGGLADWYKNAGCFERVIFRGGVLGADVIFLERKALVEEFSRIARGRVEWMPNSRPIPKTMQSIRVQKDLVRFVFLAHVKPSKGIGELLAASKRLPAGKFSIDVYGPLEDGVTEDYFDGSSVRYRGAVSPAEVSSVLSQYDVLVLPTYYHGEGHPGVIIEAFGNGLAVISTMWAGIPEIFTDEEGFLVPPKDVDALALSMTRLIESPQQLSQMKQAAKCRSKFFDSTYWASRFVEVCAEVAGVRTEKVRER